MDMSAEGNLYNPALFTGNHPMHTDLAREYLDIVKQLKTRTPFSAVKGHLFKLMRPALNREIDLRNRLGKCTRNMEEYEAIVEEMNSGMQVGIHSFLHTFP